MKELAIKRELNEDTRKQSVWCLMDGRIECFSLHITAQREVILTDHSDYTKIYSVKSLEFYQAMERSNDDVLLDDVKLCVQNYAKASAAYVEAAAKCYADNTSDHKSIEDRSLEEYKTCGRAMRELLRAVLDAAGFTDTKIIL